MSQRRVLYTAEAQVTGGRAEGHGRTSDGVLKVGARTPELGGTGGGTTQSSSSPSVTPPASRARSVPSPGGAMRRRGTSRSIRR